MFLRLIFILSPLSTVAECSTLDVTTDGVDTEELEDVDDDEDEDELVDDPLE